MTTIYDVEPAELIEKTSNELKKLETIKPPKWACFVKTGMHKERPPLMNDWWHLRASAILRKVYFLGPIGVSKLRTIYGGKKNRGYKTEHFYKSGGNNIRKILQQLQNSGLVKYVEKGVHKGRIITPKGIALLERVSTEIATRNVTSIKTSEKKPQKQVKARVQAKTSQKVQKIKKNE